eukprot:934575-Rhodomonas_salina.4
MRAMHASSLSIRDSMSERSCFTSARSPVATSSTRCQSGPAASPIAIGETEPENNPSSLPQVTLFCPTLALD